MVSDCSVHNQHMGKNGSRECPFTDRTVSTTGFLGETNILDMEPSRED